MNRSHPPVCPSHHRCARYLEKLVWIITPELGFMALLDRETAAARHYNFDFTVLGALGARAIN
jgi:hypothetical protein